jgi:hypothetical protein
MADFYIGNGPKSWCKISPDGVIEYIDWDEAELIIEQVKASKQPYNIVFSCASLAIAIREYVLNATVPEFPKKKEDPMPDGHFIGECIGGPWAGRWLESRRTVVPLVKPTNDHLLAPKDTDLLVTVEVGEYRLESPNKWVWHAPK